MMGEPRGDADALFIPFLLKSKDALKGRVGASLVGCKDSFRKTFRTGQLLPEYLSPQAQFFKSRENDSPA